MGEVECMEKVNWKMNKESVILEIGHLQRMCKEKDRAVIILLEGQEEKEKGHLLKILLECLDPRGCNVVPPSDKKQSKEKPFLLEYWRNLPEKGKIHIFDRSWYKKWYDMEKGQRLKNRKRQEIRREIREFERMLSQESVEVIKVFFQGRKQKMDMKLWNYILQSSSFSFCSWQLLEMEHEAIEDNFLAYISYSLKRTIESAKPEESSRVQRTQADYHNMLANVNLSKDVKKKEYKKRIGYLQKRLSVLQRKLEKKGAAVALVFEGWDAAGKGGAIKRITRCLDPRDYQVIPTSAPNVVEKSYPYLWRFWRNYPKEGEIVIFDRSWYGRVLVEPIEGFCTDTECERGYKEINQMENQWRQGKVYIIKFWLQIDKEEQERRFLARQNDPNKQWKLTQEDWRNREKWEEYEKMVNLMISKTSTLYAPWVIVEANQKKYARLKILETIVEKLENV
ncbi:MAG: phosphate--AMP phosphotransferase [Clostridiales bacterium]|nr:phosphate--AMP phosphotransferase [Clostridiales bacterium]